VGVSKFKSAFLKTGWHSRKYMLTGSISVVMEQRTSPEVVSLIRRSYIPNCPTDGWTSHMTELWKQIQIGIY